MVRVLKGKYFPNSSFIEAKLGSNPSYTWRSIWEARSVLELGIRKQVGDGKSIRVWDDLWIVGTQSCRVISPRRGAEQNMRVSELMVEDDEGWDVTKVRALFLPFEQARILGIRLRWPRLNDDWCWDAERDGTYSVRSAYKLLTVDGIDMVGQSDDGRNKALWNRIWNAPVLPRIKVFFWQLCNGAIYTKSNLASRVGSIDEGVEWIVDGCAGDKWVCASEGMEWVEGLRSMGVRELTVLMTGCWAIWERRNKAIFEDGEWNAEMVVRRTRELLLEMMELEGNAEGSLGEPRDVGWKKPEVGLKKINVDAGIFDGIGVGWGAVCRDGDGRVEWSVTG
ncbi:uncharacterized protein LOC141590340 [Silene latifolia]|uniref:uncharacterized protein LOC141590340 n=1 Tax=Silene latifolia TaxID=37657 RepID=UPI003D76F6E1